MSITYNGPGGYGRDVYRRHTYEPLRFRLIEDLGGPDEPIPLRDQAWNPYRKAVVDYKVAIAGPMVVVENDPLFHCPVRAPGQ